MKTLWFFLFLTIQLFSSSVFAAPSHAFASAKDLTRSNFDSNIYLHNNGNAPVSVYGLYVRELAYVTPGSTCASATTIYPDVVNGMPPNNNAGPFVAQTIVNGSKNAIVGSNYLYNMLLTSLYYVRIHITSSPPGCALPGCTWGSDSTIYNWCVKLGALGPVTTSADYTNANIPPVSVLASDTGYDYNLITDYTVIGPISCDDRTLTCTVATQQIQSF